MFPFLPFMVQFLLPEIEETDTGEIVCVANMQCSLDALSLFVEFICIIVYIYVVFLIAKGEGEIA